MVYLPACEEGALRQRPSSDGCRSRRSRGVVAGVVLVVVGVVVLMVFVSFAGRESDPVKLEHRQLTEKTAGAWFRSGILIPASEKQLSYVYLVNVSGMPFSK